MMYSFESNRIKSNRDLSESNLIVSWVINSGPIINPTPLLVLVYVLTYVPILIEFLDSELTNIFQVKYF